MSAMESTLPPLWFDSKSRDTQGFPIVLASICAYKNLFFFDLKKVKDYILITSSGECELLEHRRAEKNQNYPEKSLKNKTEQDPF